MLILKICLCKALFQKEILCKSRNKMKKTFVKRKKVNFFFGRNFCVSVNIIVTCMFVYYLEHVHTTHNSMSKYTCKHGHQTTCPWRQ